MSVNREYKGLPEGYWKKQNFCWYMHDIIVSILADCMKDDKMTTSIKFRNEDEGEKFNKAEDKVNWLYDNNYQDKADIILGKQIFHAILADMCNFIYESLSTMEKGKIAVSMALLRRPFRDNLLYLEWLLGDSKELISMVNKQEVEKYAIENLSIYKKRNIITKAMRQIDNKEYFTKMDDTTYYDLRYNYKAENSLQRVWNNANHLVTTGKYIKSTEFNFVFLDKETHLDFVDYYYKQIPHLLFYTYNIVVALYTKFVRPISNITKLYNNSLIVYKFINMLGVVKDEEYFNKETKVLLNFICNDCKSMIEINLHSKQFDDFKNGWSFLCPKCGEEISICKYVFFEDYKDEKQKLKIIK